MRTMARLLGLAGIALGAAWLARLRVRMRSRGWSLVEAWRHDIRAFVTHRFNPVVIALGLAGGRRSPWAIVEHVGRATGRVHRSPILPLPAGDYVYVPLTYGTDVHWVKNVQAAGHCRLQYHAAILDLDEPAIVGATANPAVPPALRPALERSGRRYLRLHVLAREPGAFAGSRREPVAEPIADRAAIGGIEQGPVAADPA